MISYGFNQQPAGWVLNWSILIVRQWEVNESPDVQPEECEESLVNSTKIQAGAQGLQEVFDIRLPKITGF